MANRLPRKLHERFLADVVARSRRPENQPTDALFNLGLEASLAFAGFARFVARQAAEQQVQRLFFLSREGPFLLRVVEKLAIPSLPPARVLKVSRLSTFLPAVSEFELSAWMRLWERFPRQSPRAFFESLGLQTSDLGRVLLELELPPDQPVHEPWTDSRFVALVRHPRFLELATRARDQARSMLVRYLQQEEYSTAERVAVVDVGWRGTIQDSLALLAPKTRSTGLYLAHRPPKLAPVPGVTKHGFVAGSGFGQELRICAGPLEMLCLSAGGSPTGYEETGGRIDPVLRVDAREEAVLQKDIPAFQDGVLAGVKRSFDWIEQLPPPGLPPQAGGGIALFALKRLLFSPSLELVDVYERFHLDQTFGGGASVHLDVQLLDALLAPVSRRRWLALRAAIQAHGWPHALLQRAVGKRGLAMAKRAAMVNEKWGRWFG